MELIMAQLKIAERLQIETLLKAGHNQSSIAKQLCRNRSTISNEISRNTSSDGDYCHNLAQKKTNKRRAESKEKIITEDNWTVVRVLIKQKWSPEQVSAWIKSHPDSYGFSVSTEWIYQYIKHDRANGGILYNDLRRAGKPYKLGGKKVYRGKIKDRVDITHRPEIINKRLRLGDWEVDSVIGKLNQSSIVTIVERVSRYTAIIKVSSKESAIVSDAIIKRMKSTNAPLFSITGDNGTEFTGHKHISESLGIEFYFTHPYSSWEKGTNENTNGLIRQYFPKGTDFNEVSEDMLKEVEVALNNRPRKCLQYKTPEQTLRNG
jgi:IS30 family transposase